MSENIRQHKLLLSNFNHEEILQVKKYFFFAKWRERAKL